METNLGLFTYKTAYANMANIYVNLQRHTMYRIRNLCNFALSFFMYIFSNCEIQDIIYNTGLRRDTTCTKRDWNQSPQLQRLHVARKLKFRL